MSLWGDLYEDTPVSRPTSKVDQFKKQQFDGTKVGKVEQAIIPKIAGAIEAGKKKPIIGRLINPAMELMEGIGKYVVQPITQGVSTALLTPQAMIAKKGNPIESFRFAREQSKKISMGQALATTVGQAAGAFLPDKITPSFMDDNFDIFDDKKRDQAFRNEWAGIFASGATDLVLAAIGSKGAGTIVRAGAKKVVGPKKIITPEDMGQFKTELEQIVSDQVLPAEQRTRSGLSVLVDDLVNEKDLSKLSANPLVNETSNPYRTATIVSRLDNHRDVADYLMAERGDTAAFLRFFERNPLKADHIDNYGIEITKPISSFDGLGIEELSPKLTDRYQRIIDAKKLEDRNFANALDDFLNKTKKGVVESYRPGKFAAIEQLDLARKKITNQAQYGDLKLFGEEGNSAWKVKVYQSEPYDRVIRFIAWTGSGRPQGHINISNPRRFEAANDLRSDLNRVLFLKGPEGAAFKRNMVQKFIGAQSDTQRAIALADIEQEILKRLAIRYGVTDLMDVRTMDDAIQRMKSWHSRISNDRSTLKSYAARNGYVPEDGTVNMQNWISVSNEAQTLPMLDFAKLERDMIRHLNSTRQGVIKPADVSRAKWAQRGVTLGEFLDVANMAFSNMNLVRLAYIPKNSMVDPIARASMALESTEIIRNSLPGMSNFLYNGSLRAERFKKFVPFSPKYNERKIAKQAKFNIDKFVADMQPKVTAREAAEAAADEADALLQKVTKRRDRLKARADKSNDPDVLATYHEAEDAYWDAVNNYTKANNEFNKLSDEVYGYAKLIDMEREKLVPYEFRQAELKEKTKTLGQEAEVITSASGKKYTIAGLADPNQRGVGAYMAEVDSSQNFYNASLQSEIGRRLQYEGSKFVKIKRSDGKEYWNALAHLANRQIRNELDLPLGRILRGDSDADLLKWFNTDGKEFKNRILERGVYDDLQSYIADTREKLFSYFPDEQLRQTILQRNIHWKEIEASLAGRLDLPESIDGPSMKLGDLSTFEKKLAGASGIIDAAWKVLAYSENRMARNPLFLSYARDELKTLINAAERAGFNPTEAVINNEMRQIAYRNALARVERTLYSSRRLTNGMYLMRYAMSFPMAFFNSQLVAMRLMAKNPMNAYWYNSIATAMDEFQAYEDQDGNTYKSIADVPPGTAVSVKFPLHDKLPGWAKGALKPYTDPRGGGTRINPKQLEFMVADPSISWFGGVTLSELIKDGFSVGPWKVYGEDLAKTLRNMVGDDVYESSLLYGGYPTQGGGYVDTALNTIFPGYGKSFADGLKLMFGKDGSDRAADEIVTQWKTAYAEWDRNGRVGNPPTPAQAARAAGVMMFIRSVVQFSAPISVSFDPVTRAATTYYADLVDEYKGDYDKAQKKMVEDWGVDSLALIGSSQRNVAGLAATQNDIKIIRNFGGLLESLGRANSKYAGMLSSGYDSDLTTNSQYSTEIAAIYKRLDFPGTVDLPITERKKIDGVGGIRSETEARRGWVEYQKAQEWRDAMMYQYGIQSTQSVMYERSGIKEYYNKMVDQIAKDFPGWTDAYNNNREDYWRGLIPTVEKILDDTKWRSYAYKHGDKWEEIAYWTDAARRFKTEYDRPGNTDQRKSALKTQFSQFHYDFLQTASDDFAAFAYRWLNNIPELNEELVVNR